MAMQTQTDTGIAIDSRESLNQAISRLESEQKDALHALKGDLNNVYESLKPAQVIKTVVSEVFHSPEIKKDLLQTAIGYGAGWLTNRFIAGKSPGLAKRALAHLAQVGVTNIVSGHTEEIKEKGKGLLDRFIKRYRKK